MRHANNSESVNGYFIRSNDLIMDLSPSLYLFSYVVNDDNINNQLVHKATYNISCDIYQDLFSIHDDNFLVAENDILLSQWNNETFSHEKNYYLLLKYSRMGFNRFNKDNLLTVTYYSHDSKLLVYSLKDNITVSSRKCFFIINFKYYITL